MRATPLLIPLSLFLFAGPASAADGGFHPSAFVGLILFNLLAGAGLLILLSGLGVALFDRLRRLFRGRRARVLILRRAARRTESGPLAATVSRTAAVRRQGMGG